jgi:dienelactone hydrolase
VSDDEYVNVDKSLFADRSKDGAVDRVQEIVGLHERMNRECNYREEL